LSNPKYYGDDILSTAKALGFEGEGTKKRIKTDRPMTEMLKPGDLYQEDESEDIVIEDVEEDQDMLIHRPRRTIVGEGEEEEVKQPPVVEETA